MFSSAGSVFPRESFTINGFAFARLFTSSYRNGEPTPLHEWVGDVLVTATVPGNFVGSTYVRFVKKPDALLLRPRHRLLAGDVSESGFEQVEQIDGSLRSIPYEAETIVDIFGKPNERVTVSVDREDLAYLMNPVTGELGQSLTVTLNGNGEGFVFLVSKGQLANLQEEITLTVTSASDLTSPSEPAILIAKAERQFKTNVWLVPKKVGVQLINIALGFIWGEQPGLAGAGGDIVASFFIYGDLRDTAKELGKAILPGGQDADWLVFGFAVGGLVTTLVPKIDPFIGAAKALFKVIRRIGPPAKKFGSLLVDALRFVWRNGLWQAPEGQRLLRLMKVLVLEGEEAIGDICKIANGNINFQSLLSLAGKLDDGWFAYLTRRLRWIEKQFGEETAQKVCLTLDWLNDANIIKQALRDENALMGMSKALKTVSPSRIADVLNQSIIQRYGVTKFLQGLNWAAEAENLDEILELLQKGDEAALFEFHTAVWEAERRQITISAFRKILKGTSGSAEIDAILKDGTHIQASLSNHTNSHKWKSHSGAQIKVSKERGATSVKFMFREGANIHPDILDYIRNKAPKRFGIPVDYEFVKISW